MTSFGCAQGRSGIHLGEVWRLRGDEEIDLLGALNFPGSPLLETCGGTSGQF